jgi:hypothetical protein
VKRVGDVVNFHSKAWVFEHANERYENPGVILEVLQTGTDIQENRFVAEVMWADGKVTTEYGSYLSYTGEEKNGNR